jgi:alkanesulfonate monooxygenase
VVPAKTAPGIEHISRGRFAIDLVNAWSRPEPEKAGIGFAGHESLGTTRLRGRTKARLT